MVINQLGSFPKTSLPPKLPINIPKQKKSKKNMHVRFILPAFPVPNGNAADAGNWLLLGTFDSYVESIYYSAKPYGNEFTL